MEITRFDQTEPPGPRMSRVVIAGDLVFVAGLTATDATLDIQGQTREVLARIDAYLERAGTSKARLVQAQLWLTDMALFAEMNAVWNAWVDPENPPVRACVQAQLARPGLLIEIMVTAAK